MSGDSVALDTNVAIAILNNAGEFAHGLSKYANYFLPVPVVGELRFGAAMSRHVVTNVAR